MACIILGCLLIGCGALISTIGLMLMRGGEYKLECSWFYIGFDHESFLLELGNLDKPTAMLSIHYMTKGAFNVLEET